MKLRLQTFTVFALALVSFNLVRPNSALAASLNETLNSKLISKAQKKWEEMEIKGELEVSKDASFGQFGYLTGEIGYKYLVQPALESGSHQRMDAYFIGASIGAADLLQIGVGGHVQVSYSNLHLEKNSALKQRPASITKFPFSAEDALKRLKPGEAARLEISSKGLAGAGFLNELLQANYLGLEASYKRGNLVVVEIYRLNDRQFRIRFISNRDVGTVTSGLSLKPYLDFGVLDRVVNGLFSCKPFSVRRSQSMHQLPLDTMVADYQVDLSNNLAKFAFDQVLRSWSLMDVREQFLSLSRPEDFSSGFWRAFNTFDQFYRSQDLSSGFQPAITRSFKARLLSEQIVIDKGSACFKIWDLQGKESHVVSSVRIYDEREYHSDTFYMRTQNESEKSFIKRNQNVKGQRETEMLFHASRTDPANPASGQIGALTDYVMNFEQEERELSKSEFNLLINDFNYQYNVYNQEVNLADLINRLPNQKKLTQKTRVVIDPAEMRRLKVRSFDDYKFLFTQHVMSHPVPGMIPTTKTALEKIGIGVPIAARFERDINEIAQGLTLALDPQTTNFDFYQAMRKLKRNKMFQFMGASFLISLFPEDGRNRGVRFKYTLQQDDSVIYAFSSNEYRNTEQYQKVSAVMDSLKNREFDLQTQIDAINRLTNSPLPVPLLQRPIQKQD